MKKTVLVDFDGVIHSYTSGWHGADTISDPPVEGAFDFLREAILEFKVCIYSSRSREPGGIEAMRKWFIDYELPFEILDALDFPTKKPAAFLTIDDRAFCFKGTFPTMRVIRNFKPWNKK